MNMGFSSVGNGGSSSSFSNLSHLAPPFTLDRSVTRAFSSPLVDITEPSFVVGAGVPVDSTLHNWLPSTSKTSGLDFFSNSTTPEFDWLSFPTGSKYPRLQSSDNHGPLLGSLTISSTGDTSDGLTTCIGTEKPYYPSYASTSCNKGGPMVIVDQPTYDCPSKSHVVTFNVPPYTDFSHGSSPSGFERSVEEAPHSTHMFDLNKCNDFVRECPNEELLPEQNLNIEQPKNLRISNMDAHSAFPGCHPKTKIRTPPSYPASSFHNSQYLRKAPYQEILREQDAILSVPTSIVNSPNTFSKTDSFVWNTGPCQISGNGDHFFKAKQGGYHLSNLKKSPPVNSDSQEFFSTEHHGTCIDKHDPIIHDLQNNIHYAADSPDHTLEAGMGLHVPDAIPQFSLNLKTIETATTIESSSESFDQYNLAAVDSPCWKGAPISGFSPFQAFEISTPSHLKTVEVNNDVNLSLSPVPPSTEDTMEVFVHKPNENIIGSILEKGATSSAKMPSIVDSSLLATQNTNDSVKAGEFYSEMGCFRPTTGCIHEDGGDFYSSCSMPQSKYKNNLMSGKKIAPTSFTKRQADARLNSDDSSENGLNHLSSDVAEHVQNLPFELVKVFLGESISKVDMRILVNTLHSLSELLLVCHSKGLAALQQNDVKSLETVMNNLDICLNSVRSQGSLSPEQRTSQNLEQFHQLHSDFQDVGVLKSQSQMTKIEGENLECLSNDGNDVDKTNQDILSVKKDNKAADSLYLGNRIDSVKEDSMTKALKKIMSENFHDDEEHPQTLLYKNLWLEAEAALCASNLRARFNSAKLEMEKHESPKVREHAKNWDEAFISDASPDSNIIGKLASKTKVGSTPFVSFQNSPAMSVTSHADDVITRFHILKCREDEARLKDVGNSVTASDFEVSVKQDVAEKSALGKKQTAVPYIKDMDSSFPASKGEGNDSGAALPPISPTLTRSSHIDDIMSRFQILKSRGERISSLNVGKVQKITNSSCEIDVLAHKGDIVHSLGISTMHHDIADNKKEVANLDDSVLARQDVLRRCGNDISSIPAGEQILEVEVEHMYPGSKRVDWPVGENKVKKGGLGVEMEPFLGLEAVNGSRNHIEGKVPGGCSDGSSSTDWEHVLWCE